MATLKRSKLLITEDLKKRLNKNVVGRRDDSPKKMYSGGIASGMRRFNRGGKV